MWRYRIEEMPAGHYVYACPVCDPLKIKGLRAPLGEDELLTGTIPDVAAFMRAGGDCGAVAYQPPRELQLPTIFYFPCLFAVTGPFVEQMQQQGATDVLLALRGWHLDHHRRGHFTPATNSPFPFDSWAPTTDTAADGSPVIRCPEGCPSE
jgi:hypothetical protein